MRTLDISPLLRSSIGFDRFNRLLDASLRAEEQNGFPPYNIEKPGEDHYRITMAVSGYAPDELDVTVKEQSLFISGKAKPEDKEVRYLHRGIARRAFVRRFDLADSVRVTGAKLENGLLHVDLVHEVPEAVKPRKVSIQTGSSAGGRTIEASVEQDAA